MAATRDKDGVLIDAWRSLLDQHARTVCALERELEDQHGIGMSEFEVLDRLASNPEGCGRIQEIANAVHLSQSALSRAVARLEADGLVERSICENDRRGIYACLTDAGRERHKQARPTHRAVLREMLA